MPDSAPSVDRIERIADLMLPPEAEAVFDHLTKGGAERFSQEIVQALFRAQMKGDLRPVLDVVESWYRTLLVRNHPDYEESAKWARAGGSGATYPAEDLVAHFSE